MARNEIKLQVTDDIIRVKAEGACLCAATVSALFCALAEDGIPVDLISFSRGETANSLTFSVASHNITKVLKAVAQGKEKTALRILARGGFSKITLRGKGLSNELGIAAACFRALGKAQTDAVLLTASGTDISVLIETEALDRTLFYFEQTFHTTVYEV